MAVNATIIRDFSLLLIAFVNIYYRLLWEGVQSSGSSSYPQIFNRSKLRKKIEDVTLELLKLGEGGLYLHYFLLVTVPLLDAMDSEIRQNTTHKRRENSKLQDFQKQEGYGEYFCNPCRQIQGLTGHNGVR